MSKILLILALAILLTGCMNTYFEQLGGFPLESETLVMKESGPALKLLVTYRHPYKAEVIDTTILNISVNVIVSKEELEHLSIDRLTLASTDNSYLMSYSYPAVYDTYATYPVSLNYTNPETGEKITYAEQPCLFTVNNQISEYEITIFYRVFNKEGISASYQHSAIINISNIQRKTHYL
jgi:hypothetical protein